MDRNIDSVICYLYCAQDLQFAGHSAGQGKKEILYLHPIIFPFSFPPFAGPYLCCAVTVCANPPIKLIKFIKTIKYYSNQILFSIYEIKRISDMIN